MKKLIIILIAAAVALTSCTMNFIFKLLKRYEWYASGNAPLLYPTELFYGDFIFSNGKKLYIPISIPYASKWGQTGKTHILDNNFFPAPAIIDIIWFSWAENQFYSLESTLPKEKIESLLAEIDEETKEPRYQDIIVGMAPYGGLAIWLSGNGKTTEVAWLQAKPTDVEMKDFAPTVEYTQKEYRDLVFKGREEAYENFQENGLPDRMLFERYMQKFNYRFTPKFENEEAVFEEIELYYYNGELNTTNSGEHAENALRAKPSKIVLNWSTGDAQYGGYFWTDEKKIIETFDKFYKDDTQKAGNLFIEVGASNEQFKFFLQDDTTTVEIPAEEIEMIVFKNKYEFFRNENYNRPIGGWKN